LKLIESARSGFELSVLPILSLPIGSSAFTSGGYDPTMEIAWAQSLPRGLSLSGNVTAASVSQDDHRFTQHILTLSVDRDVAAGWNAFAEAFRASSFERESAAVWMSIPARRTGWGVRRSSISAWGEASRPPRPTGKSAPASRCAAFSRGRADRREPILAERPRPLRQAVTPRRLHRR
jgi:hypothetical protein